MPGDLADAGLDEICPECFEPLMFCDCGIDDEPDDPPQCPYCHEPLMYCECAFEGEAGQIAGWEDV